MPEPSPAHLGAGRCSVLHVQAQGFVPAALTDQLCRIQSHVLVQDWIALQKTWKAQHETQELKSCHLEGMESAVCAQLHTLESQRVKEAIRARVP